MELADDWALEQLVGKRVAFKSGDEHSACWHQRVGLRSGVVLRLGQTLAQKAELFEAEGLHAPEGLPNEEAEVVRLWVKVDPCVNFPRGCEVAVEKECLLVS
jgi:hypothetical protein